MRMHQIQALMNSSDIQGVIGQFFCVGFNQTLRTKAVKPRCLAAVQKGQDGRFLMQISLKYNTIELIYTMKCKE